MKMTNGSLVCTENLVGNQTLAVLLLTMQRFCHCDVEVEVSGINLFVILYSCWHCNVGVEMSFFGVCFLAL